MLKILLIEDNETDALLTQDILADQDILAEWNTDQFEVKRVACLHEALDQITRGRYDAVLLDLSLPDGYGLALLEQIQAANPRIPVIVLSGLSDQGMALQAVHAGAQDYLVKGRCHGELLARSIRYAIERKRAEERLTYLAQYDQLTGLVNRTLFRDRLLHAIARSKRLQQGIGLMLLDLDRFKTVNDTWGHEAGDQVLQAAADRIKACVREVDTVARMGGDEFTVIVEGLSQEEDLAHIAERIISSMIEPFCLSSGQAVIGVSIGMTVYPYDDHDIDDLLRHADAAMYRAKQRGGNSFEFHVAAHSLTPPFQSKPP
ncbi:MAG: GGDEF domain-containing response regulator [Nitrospira sp.]|nr:GGDEF domain-containing response regulator [Nitrospira sp.]